MITVRRWTEIYLQAIGLRRSARPAATRGQLVVCLLATLAVAFVLFGALLPALA